MSWGPGKCPRQPTVSLRSTGQDRQDEVKPVTDAVDAEGLSGVLVLRMRWKSFAASNRPAIPMWSVPNRAVPCPCLRSFPAGGWFTARMGVARLKKKFRTEIAHPPALRIVPLATG